MKGEGQEHFSMDFIEEDGKAYVLFYDPVGNLVAKREIPHQYHRSHSIKRREQLSHGR